MGFYTAVCHFSAHKKQYKNALEYKEHKPANGLEKQFENINKQAASHTADIIFNTLANGAKKSAAP
jgi:hypothetical protein